MEGSVEEIVEGVRADDIDLAFAPRPVETLTAREVDGGLVLLDDTTGLMHALDTVGAVIYECFDGEVELGELSEELAEAFGADVEVVRRDVVELTKNLARVGLLQGIVQPQQVSGPQGLEVGEELPPFRLADLDGTVVNLADLRGRRVLLVNWSPHCGYCAEIAPELGTLKAPLEEHDTELVFLTAGDAAANRRLLDEHGEFRVLLKSSAGDDFPDPFPAMGTPVAYLLDAEGRVAAPLAYGADLVPALARTAAAVEEESPAVADDVKYIPGSDAMCAPGASGAKKPRDWRPTVAYRIGEYHVGIRTESEEAEELVARFLSAHHFGVDPNAPANYSVLLNHAHSGSRRELNLLLSGNATVVRTRSPGRLLLGLAAFLSRHVVEDDDSLLWTANYAVVAGEDAFVVPVAAELDQLQPKLAKLGLSIVDEPHAAVDPDRCELVVPEPRVSVDRSVLDELEEPRPSRAELPRVEAGRYRLRAWLTPGLEGSTAPLSRAQVVYAGVASVITSPDKLPSALDRVVALFEGLPTPTVREPDAEHIAGLLAEQLAAAR